MTRFKNSDLIIPISVVIHLGIINVTLSLLTPDTYNSVYHILYYNVTWLLITYGMGYYPTSRKERFTTNLNQTLRLYLTYGLAYFALFGVIGKIYKSFEYQLFVYLLICAFLILYRILFYWARRNYRTVGGNSVNVIVMGDDPNLTKIQRVFDEPELGYRYLGYFDDNLSKSSSHLGKIIDCFRFTLDHKVDEIYCFASKFNHKELKNLVNFADNNLIKINIIPDNKEIISRTMSIELYDSIPVLRLRKVPLDTEYSRIAKRTFDIIFSSLVLIFILSWLTPLLFILIKLESPGNLFFKQKRHGLKRNVFWCYKFRSMHANGDSHKRMASKNDSRTTRIGKLLRRTSIDELPQFYNVFMGDMSVVGPRPHMELHTWDYQTTVDKYLVRHFVKPGITGLAQIRGYRGEITKKADILNRVRLDIFYIEKWSLALDLRIVYQTIGNAFKGEENAY
ncbi:undecaprenyl-phosphate glucose phosphotransferase [Pricia sp. S334]|uniref:Undecaprenyl-phosphate glucose phosphotransferase n=1 Tax=Pricia mediterranea TaxID=3076079 RepID=A0ABU3L2X9_9FLAO|nr:undecaprenyl-phosphate glucose phosphotransferase [Pricia sp. S334]MDT7828094.1 undecaprenyl-phosphate glucose phosphotransferase [Pricia sp. S334]